VKYIATPVGINELAKNRPILYLDNTGQWLYISHETQMESLIFYFSNGQYVGKYPVSVFPLYVGNWNSGVYYYRISDGKSFSYTGKLVMIR
ncbi:MAG: hypothetical protein N2Z72_08535, partial [Bacteroidales bacterium]|nr:hypothetical protein [Bacteroidales bacterium]